MVGKIDFDETRLVHVSAWVPGRIDRLFVNFVGANIAKGEHLTYLYSPDLRTAQEEFLIANRRWEQARRAGGADEIASAQAARDAVEKKLQLWGILPAQVQELIRTGRGDDHMTIFAPMGGTVIAKEAFEGKYVQAGDRLFTIADLHSVWAILEAYETDIGWLRYGQGVQFEMDAYPGQVFRGRIAFISPTVNEATRTTRVRVSLPNADLRLKPGMYVRALVDAKLNQAGRIMAPEFAGKWMCPMHPEIVKDVPGKCPVCGMDLVESAKLGFGRPEVPARRVLSIPAAAPLLTGTRAVVYVEEQKDGETAYVGRQVELGPRAGDYYIVVSGLQDGERVVTRGNFKIDSALQIQAKPSMMKPDYEPASAPAAAPATRPADRASQPASAPYAPDAAREPAPATGGSK
jgi:Cu(I)/Ag(I) efflux system membrane fusion protein